AGRPPLRIRLENRDRACEFFCGKRSFRGHLSNHLQRWERRRTNHQKPNESRGESSIGRAIIQLCKWNFTTSFLCLCHAVYEYVGHCKKRNKFLEMADVAIGGNDGHRLCALLGRLSNFKIA